MPLMLKNLAIGILQAHSLSLFLKTPFLAPPGEEVDKSKPFAGFQGDDTVVAIDDTVVVTVPTVQVRVSRRIH